MAVLGAFRYVGRGLLFALAGLGAGAAVALGLAGLAGRDDPSEIVITLGYVGALAGWLLGIGIWDAWAREWVGRPVRSLQGNDLGRFFRFNTDHKVVGVQYLVTFVVIFLLAGFLAMLMRLELMSPGEDVLNARDFNTTMSLHGIMMVAVAVATIIGGFANFGLPLLIGAEDVAFPRVNSLSYWIVPPVAVLLLLTPFFGGMDSGWTAYPPLSVVNAQGQLLFLLAFLTFGFSSILGGMNFIVTIVKMRAPGMTWGRLPIFVWAILCAAIISLTATQFVAFGLVMVILDRVVGTGFFDAARGGNALLYEHIFWFYSHPAVYIMILPAFGLLLEVLAHFSRKPVFAYKLVVGALFSIVALSFVVWAHHLFTSGMQDFLHVPFMVVTELISIPTGVVFLAALGTIWRGRLWLATPMLFALGVVFNFAIGGITGIFLADVATDIQLQDTYFVVAHFHYTIVGGEIFAIFAGLYYWFPKVTGRMYNETWGRVHFWWMFLMYNITFLPMFWVGVYGMNRRVADYSPNLGSLNQFISISAFLLGGSFIVFVLNMSISWAKGRPAGANPWRARTLEWQTSSPPPVENFPAPPRVVGYPYDYGVPNSIHAIVGAAGGSGHREEKGADNE